jgi:uncharacterized protein YbjQ (UPF0145 family)
MYDLLVLVTLLALGFWFGRQAERRHYRSILEREEALRGLMVFSARLPPDLGKRREVRLVTGSVVVSVDYFKSFVAGLRSLIGGRLTSYESLLDRARREAILRMKEDARALEPCMIFNVKLATSTVSVNSEGGAGAVEMLAYGTAVAIET